jgi:hypothetical protein
MARTIANQGPIGPSAPALSRRWAARLTDAACLLVALVLAGGLSGAIMGSAILAGGGPRLEAGMLGPAGAPLAPPVARNAQ